MSHTNESLTNDVIDYENYGYYDNYTDVVGDEDSFISCQDAKCNFRFYKSCLTSRNIDECCISKEDWCNGEIDCLDLSDEENCDIEGSPNAISTPNSNSGSPTHTLCSTIFGLFYLTRYY
jgi:hypothetical protein